MSALLVALAVLGADAQKNLGVREERYELKSLRTTILEVNLGRVIDRDGTWVNMTLFQMYSGKRRTTPAKSAMVHFFTYSDDPNRYRGAQDIAINYGGSKLALRTPDSDGADRNSLFRRKAREFDRLELTKICGADSVGGQLGADSFTLTAQQMAALKEFGSYIADPELEVKRGPAKSEVWFAALMEGAAREEAEAEERNAQTRADAARAKAKLRGEDVDGEPSPKPAPKPNPADQARRKEAEARFDKAVADSAKAELIRKADTKLKMAQGLEKAKKPKAAIDYYEAIVKDFAGTTAAKTATERLKALKPKKAEAKVGK
jgi:hypothetical protein